MCNSYLIHIMKTDVDICFKKELLRPLTILLLYYITLLMIENENKAIFISFMKY